MFTLSPDVAADTGTHIGDGNLYIKTGKSHGAYTYSITGHALEDQLYLFGTVIPTVSAAYSRDRCGFYFNPERTWISVKYQSKSVALFKHEVLGLPNGRKTSLSIPSLMLREPQLMKHLARELLATDGLLGIYNANSNAPYKYPRIQIRLKSSPVIGQLANFLRTELGMNLSCRTVLSIHPTWRSSLQQILQISRSEDIETWRREIGFSNPFHISRLMVLEALGECVPGTSIVDRLSFLSGRSSELVTSSDSITPVDLASVIDDMRRKFGFPRVSADAILQKLNQINERLGPNLGRRLPALVH